MLHLNEDGVNVHTTNSFVFAYTGKTFSIIVQPEIIPAKCLQVCMRSSLVLSFAQHKSTRHPSRHDDDYQFMRSAHVDHG